MVPMFLPSERWRGQVGIPFTQYVLPDGRQREVSIERPGDIEKLAQRFIDDGGRYECEILTDGTVSLTAVADVYGEPADVEIVLCANGPAVPPGVDELVRKSVQHTAAA